MQYLYLFIEFVESNTYLFKLKNKERIQRQVKILRCEIQRCRINEDDAISSQSSPLICLHLLANEVEVRMMMKQGKERMKRMKRMRRMRRMRTGDAAHRS